MGYREMVLALPGLKTYHRLDGGGTEASIGPDTALMTYSGSPASAPGLVKKNPAKSFNGSQLGTFSTSSLAGGVVTLIFWFKELVRVDWSTFAGHDDWPNSRMGVTRRAAEDNLISGWRDGVGGNDYGCVGAYKPLDVNFVVLTINTSASRGNLYINGVLRDTQPHAGVLPAGSLPFGVGGNNVGPSANAIIDEVATLTTEMDTTTQAALYKAGLKSGVLAGLFLPI